MKLIYREIGGKVVKGSEEAYIDYVLSRKKVLEYESKNERMTIDIAGGKLFLWRKHGDNVELWLVNNKDMDEPLVSVRDDKVHLSLCLIDLFLENVVGKKVSE